MKVSEGYARNYLFPKKLAMEASERNKKILEAEGKVARRKDARMLKESKSLAEGLEKISCEIRVKAGENEKLFGSVTAKDIADSLKAQGVEVDKKDVLLEEPIKELGRYTVEVRLHPEVTGKVKVWVVKE